MKEIAGRLRDFSFTETDYVYEPGQYAVRGSILDIFAYSLEEPVRLDFFGDDIESIRTFDVETQLSTGRLDSIDVTAQVGARNRLQSLLDYVPDNTLVVTANEGLHRGRIRAIAAERHVGPHPPCRRRCRRRRRGQRRGRRRRPSPRALPPSAACATPHAKARSTPRRANGGLDCAPQVYHKNFDLIADSFTRFRPRGLPAAHPCRTTRSSSTACARFSASAATNRLQAVEGTLHEGFVDHEAKVCVFTDHQIFDRFHKYTLKSDRARSGRLALSMKELGQIEPGDYIVHLDHGVGRFEGLLRTNVNGRMQEVIKLVYQNNDVLFVSIHALHKARQIPRQGGVPPKINRIGSGAWQKIKEQDQGQAQRHRPRPHKALRRAARRRASPSRPTATCRHELEASFIYEDTPDQLTATQAVKADMESERPMDRLFGGDVGFGKTEIAIRAASSRRRRQQAGGRAGAPPPCSPYQHYPHLLGAPGRLPGARGVPLARTLGKGTPADFRRPRVLGKIDITRGHAQAHRQEREVQGLLGLLIIDEEQSSASPSRSACADARQHRHLTMTATPIPRTTAVLAQGARSSPITTTPQPLPHNHLHRDLNDRTVAEAINFEPGAAARQW